MNKWKGTLQIIFFFLILYIDNVHFIANKNLSINQIKSDCLFVEDRNQHIKQYNKKQPKNKILEHKSIMKFSARQKSHS